MVGWAGAPDVTTFAAVPYVGSARIRAGEVASSAIAAKQTAERRQPPRFRQSARPVRQPVCSSVRSWVATHLRALSSKAAISGPELIPSMHGSAFGPQ